MNGGDGDDLVPEHPQFRFYTPASPFGGFSNASARRNGSGRKARATHTYPSNAAASLRSAVAGIGVGY